MTSAYPQEWPVTAHEGRLPATLSGEVLALLADCEEADGNPPFSEQTIVLMRSPETRSEELLSLVIYAVDDSSENADPEDLAGAVAVSFPESGLLQEGIEPEGIAEIAVHPAYRNQGVGARLVEALRSLRGSRGLAGLTAWSHGDHAAAAELAAANGFAPRRELLKMVLTHHDADDSASPVSPDTLADGIVVRAFHPGHDEEAWLAANAAAFADHPEQGTLRRSDLEARMAESWFDPAGFFLAVDENDVILGFHWTKVHPAHRGHHAVGEVYAVGVTPAAQGRGLGRALTLRGIAHLRSLGLGTVMLYADADNEVAVSLYRKLGFTRWDADVLYAPTEQKEPEALGA